ncbi:VP5 [CHeRI orbivirus 3-1]|uniref:Outer capsid protein VP5 n=1 Tax=CHeRI orbivirus 3-4 TaxID=2729576 RepID=A0A6M3SNC8_9REOV|nr:VP5 [CHeRI orbivirus 3-1]QJD38996.1 VP5 [CHeRI orbivirus 3-4]
MGKFSSALARVGRGIRNVVTSDTTRRVLSGIGSAAVRVAESELGQKAIAGVVQGVAETVLTEGDLGTNIKKAVIGNVIGIHDQPIDPLNPSEQLLNNKLTSLQKEMKTVEELDKHHQNVEAKLTASVENIRAIIKNQSRVTAAEENQVSNLDTSVRAMLEITEHEAHGLQLLNEALGKEARQRSRDETKIVEAVRHNYNAMAAVVKAEKEAILEEAIEQTMDIGGEIAEHIAAEIPLVGESVATGMATARGVQQMYQLAKTISRISGVEVEHAEVPAISPITLETLLTNDSVTDNSLQKIISAKMRHIEEIKKEIEHINEVVVAEMKRRAADESGKTGTPDTTIHQTLRSNFHVPRNRRPGIHIFTAPYDSEQVIIFLVNSPYSVHRAFLLCVDLGVDFIWMHDISHGGTRVHRGPKIGGLPSLRNACREFFRDTARHASSSRIHTERMLRSAGNEPIYMATVKYPYSYSVTRRHAEIICKNQEVQRHLLRGPLSMQRMSLLNTLQHGITLLSTTKSRSIQQGTRIPRPIEQSNRS